MVSDPDAFNLVRLDKRRISTRDDEVLCFVCLKNEAVRLKYFFKYYRDLGVDRFFVIDNRSNDGSREYLLEQPDCHVFDCGSPFFSGNVEPPTWTNALLNVFGHDRWCLTVDPDELLVYPNCEAVPLARLCSALDAEGADTLYAPLLDMYPEGPIAKVPYQPGAPFLGAAPYFDGEAGWIKPIETWSPPIQLFGGVRERVFWRQGLASGLPPCLSKVPLTRWRRGRRYLVVTHTISDARLSRTTGRLLHFKFLTGFVDTMRATVEANSGVVEKGLEERAAYSEALRRHPDLRVFYEGSTRYESSAQLVRMGFMSAGASG